MNIFTIARDSCACLTLAALLTALSIVVAPSAATHAAAVRQKSVPCPDGGYGNDPPAVKDAIARYESIQQEIKREMTDSEAALEREVSKEVNTGPKDEFETTAEYDARMRKAAQIRESLRPKYRSERDAKIIPLQREAAAIIAHEYTDKVEFQLGPYNADREEFTLILPPLEHAVPLAVPRSQARLLKENFSEAEMTGIYQLRRQGSELRGALKSIKVSFRGATYQTQGDISLSINVIDYTRIVPPQSLTRKPQILSKPEPGFTEEARASGVQGSIVLGVMLEATGEVGAVEVVKGLPCGLTEKSVLAAKRIKFIPGQKDGQPVSTVIRIEYNFNIY